MSAAGREAVEGRVNYIGAMTERPRFYAQDHSRDVLALDPRTIRVADARYADTPPTLEREGFTLVRHVSEVGNFRDSDAVKRIHPGEIERLLLDRTGASRVIVTGAGVLRFGESSKEAGTLLNSLPARFIHVDVSDPTAAQFAARTAGGAEVLATSRRYAHYNVWRVLSDPPQDIPLAVCDARTVAAVDLLPADAIFDAPGQPEWSFEGLVVHHSPAHRWNYFSNMSRDEALVFKNRDSDLAEPHCVPHTAFDDPSCRPGGPTRASIEMRAIAYFD